MSQHNWQALAAHAWSYLVESARQQRDRYYSELGNEIGIHHRLVRFPLELLQDYCLREGKPPLTILVISQGTGQPGAGFSAASRELAVLSQNRQEVFDWPWQAEPNPFAFALDGATREEIVLRILNHTEEAAEVYQQIGSRGTAQDLFREALLTAYEGRCAFTGSTLKGALDAAHIIPWSKATHVERLAVSNGLLLNTYFHRLLYRDILWLDEGYAVRLNPRIHFQELSSFDQQALEPVIDQLIRLPINEEFFPSKALIRRRNEGRN